MKYTSPIYTNEAVETTDVICESPFTIAHVTTPVWNKEKGEYVDTPTTQVQVDISKLF